MEIDEKTVERVARAPEDITTVKVGQLTIIGGGGGGGGEGRGACGLFPKAAPGEGEGGGGSQTSPLLVHVRHPSSRSSVAVG